MLNRDFQKIILTCLLLLPLTAFTQPAHIAVQSSDTTKSESKGSNHSLFAGTGYGSNLVYLGSTISQDNPFGYGTVAYGFRNEIFASISAVHVSGLSPLLAFYIGSLNYSHVFNDWFDISASASRYQVVPSLTDTLFSSFSYGEITLGFDWKLLYSKISGGGLFSEDNQAFFQFRNSRYFQTPEFSNGKANISFDPYFNLLFGTVTEVESDTETAYYYSVSSKYHKLRKNGQNHTTTTTYTYTDRFGLLEMDFGLPVSLNTDLMTIEAEPSYVIPFYDDSYYFSTKGFVFQVSIFFRIF